MRLAKKPPENTTRAASSRPGPPGHVQNHPGSIYESRPPAPLENSGDPFSTIDILERAAGRE